MKGEAMSKERPGISLDFDAWRELATRDPVRFEALRGRAIDAAIRRAPKEHQHRLRCLQWRIDAVRHRSGTPLAATIRISGMMSESLARLTRVLQEGGSGGTKHPARVIPFKRPH